MTRDVVKKFFYTLSLNELNLMNHNQLCPDVSYNTLLYLDLIYFIPDCTASKIAQQLHISKPAVTSKINDMIAQGLVKKGSEPERQTSLLSHLQRSGCHSL